MTTHLVITGFLLLQLPGADQNPRYMGGGCKGEERKTKDSIQGTEDWEELAPSRQALKS